MTLRAQIASAVDVVIQIADSSAMIDAASSILPGSRASLAKLLATGADFIVRSGWHSIRLVTLDGNPVDWNAIYAPMTVGGHP